VAPVSELSGASRRTQPSKLTLQRVDPRQVAPRVVIAASLAGFESEPAPRVSLTSTLAAQVNDRRKVLPLVQ
jgi:hypothetical protein